MEAATMTIATPVRLNRTDMRAAVALLTPQEVRFLVDRYYQVQDDRKRSASQVRAAGGSGGPTALLSMVNEFEHVVECQIKGAMGLSAARFGAGRWAQAQDGIGPVLSAGLQAIVDMSRCSSAAALWRFAGLDPTVTWHGAEGARKLIDAALPGHRGALSQEQVAVVASAAGILAEKIYQRHAMFTENEVDYEAPLTRDQVARCVSLRPYSAMMKQIAYHIGACFIRVRGAKPQAYYGLVYERHKLGLIQRNLAGEFAEAAAEGAARVGKGTDAYKAYSNGRLPDGHVDARARRYVAKFFLSHYWEARYRCERGHEPPRPWARERGGHKDYCPPPGPEVWKE